MPSLPTLCCGPSFYDTALSVVSNPSIKVLVVGMVLVVAGFWMKSMASANGLVCWTRNTVAYSGLALVMYYALVKLVLPVQQLF